MSTFEKRKKRTIFLLLSTFLNIFWITDGILSVRRKRKETPIAQDSSTFKMHAKDWICYVIRGSTSGWI